MVDKTQIEKTGSGFNIDKYLKARELTKQVVKSVSKNVWEGMTEKEGSDLIDQELKKLSSEKKWHPNKFRIGVNTLKDFKERSEDGVTLKKNDLFFIDIGPVFEGHEGDYGETFVFGESVKFQECIEASKKLFQETSEQVKEGATGARLYEFALKRCEELGYQLNLKMDGHRLGDFPHAIHFKGSLSEVNFTPSSHLWVLEILIRHKKENFGAFFEDIVQN